MTKTEQTTSRPPVEYSWEVKDDPAFEERFRATMARKTLRKPPPPFIKGTRAHPERMETEDELCRRTHDFFATFEEDMDFYSEHTPYDVTWMTDWLKRYWVAWDRGIDEDLVRQTVAEDCVYKDPVSFGRPMVGIQAFLDYNYAFFEAIPDLRYDGIPGECSVSVAANGEVLFMARYTGCGHWDEPLRMYPWTKNARALPATGAFMRAVAVDRYHFSPEGRIIRGETLWDAFEGLQMSSVLPSDTSLAFNAMLTVGNWTSRATRLRRKLPIIGGETY